MSDDRRASAHLAKIVIDLPDGTTESLWAEPVAADQFRIMNVPFSAFGLSPGDVVVARAGHGLPVFAQVVERSGHSAFRIALQGGVSTGQFDEAWLRLREIGCHFERFTTRMYGVDVPPETDAYAAYALLEEGMSSGLWWFDEVHVGHPLRPRDV